MPRLTLLPAILLLGLTECGTHHTSGVEFLNPGTVLPNGLHFSEAVRVDDR